MEAAKRNRIEAPLCVRMGRFSIGSNRSSTPRGSHSRHPVIFSRENYLGCCALDALYRSCLCFEGITHSCIEVPHVSLANTPHQSTSCGPNDLLPCYQAAPLSMPPLIQGYVNTIHYFNRYFPRDLPALNNFYFSISVVLFINKKLNIFCN